MTAFTILTRENLVPGNTDPDPRASNPTGDRRAAPLEPAVESPRPHDASAGFEVASLPAVVLQLPDVKASGQTRGGWRFRSASQLYWVALVLGALVALWLITASGEEPPERPASEAPPWAKSGSVNSTDAAATPGTASDVARPSGDQAGSAAPSIAAPQAPSHSPAYFPSWPEPTAPTAAAADNSSQPTVDTSPTPPQASELRTARSVDAHWDGSSPAVQPGTAAPLGIGTPEQK